MSLLRRSFSIILTLLFFAIIIGGGILVGVEIGPLPLMLGIVFAFWLVFRRDEVSYVLGSARIATYVDLVFSGLIFESGGVLLGQTRNLDAPSLRTKIKAIFTLPLSMSRHANAIFGAKARNRNWLRLPRHIGYHMAFIAPTGGGKSAGNVISNLLTDSSSAIVMDYKGELLANTAYARMTQFGHKVICIAPSACHLESNSPSVDLTRSSLLIRRRVSFTTMPARSPILWSFTIRMTTSLFSINRPRQLYTLFPQHSSLKRPPKNAHLAPYEPSSPSLTD